MIMKNFSLRKVLIFFYILLFQQNKKYPFNIFKQKLNCQGINQAT